MGRIKYKVAIQFFGHVRSYRETYKYQFKNIFDLYDCDFFMHTWSDEEHSDLSWHSDFASGEKNKTSRESLCEIYDLKSLLIEDNSIISYDGFFNENNNIPLRAMKAMLYSQSKVNELRRQYQEGTGTHYDFVLTLRPDVLPLSQINIVDYINEFNFCENVTIHFPSGEHELLQGSKRVHTLLAVDVLYLAQPDTCNKIFLDHEADFKKFYVEFNSVNLGGISAPEASFHELLVQRGVIPRCYNLPYALVRTQGDNHMKVNFEYLQQHDDELPVPDYLVEADAKKRSLFYLFAKKLDSKKLTKIQKELKRFKSRVARMELCIQEIKESK